MKWIPACFAALLVGCHTDEYQYSLIISFKDAETLVVPVVKNDCFYIEEKFNRIEVSKASIRCARIRR